MNKKSKKQTKKQKKQDDEFIKKIGAMKKQTF